MRLDRCTVCTGQLLKELRLYEVVYMYMNCQSILNIYGTGTLYTVYVARAVKCRKHVAKTSTL